ncbi:MAG: hypothetical protein FD189_1081 [Elusimicrobia bacterium]|nr:MAG: hypothetical protein FD189_1081 [Elusimicrobiota bacterium]
MARRRQRGPRREFRSARPPQGRTALVMDLPAQARDAGAKDMIREILEASAVRADPENYDEDSATILRALPAIAASLRVAQIVEAKPGHLVIALPQEGSAEAADLMDRCGRAVYESQPWPTPTGKPPVPWEKVRVEALDKAILCKAVAGACLAAAGAYLEEWGKEGGGG